MDYKINWNKKMLIDLNNYQIIETLVVYIFGTNPINNFRTVIVK
jgi:hypothetical protein